MLFKTKRIIEALSQAEKLLLAATQERGRKKRKELERKAEFFLKAARRLEKELEAPHPPSDPAAFNRRVLDS